MYINISILNVRSEKDSLAEMEAEIRSQKCLLLSLYAILPVPAAVAHPHSTDSESILILHLLHIHKREKESRQNGEFSLSHGLVGANAYRKREGNHNNKFITWHRN